MPSWAALLTLETAAILEIAALLTFPSRVTTEHLHASFLLRPDLCSKRRSNRTDFGHSANEDGLRQTHLDWESVLRYKTL